MTKIQILGDIMAKVSEEIKALHGKEGKLTDLVRQYLDVKKANYKIVKAEPGERAARIKGVDPFVEQGSIMIEKDEKKVIIEELTKICGMSGRFHQRGDINIDSILDKARRVLFRTFKDSKDLYIHMDLEAKEPTYGGYLGGGNISIRIKDILKEPSKIPEYDEAYEINCECVELGKLKCKGKAWMW